MTFKLWGVKFEITFFFVAFITFIISLKAPANLIITIASSMLHETGHLSMMILVGERPKKIKLELVGMNIIREKNFKISAKKEMVISLGGPIMNFVIIIISCMVLCFYENYTVMTCACINLILMIFNLLPIKSLDGGATLYFLLSQYFEAHFCRKILKIISIVCIAIIYIWAIYVFVVSQYNFSLIIIAIFLTISLFQNNDY